MNEQECQELLMSEVTGIDLVSRSGWTLPVPFGVSNVSEMTVTDYPPAAILLSSPIIDMSGTLNRNRPGNKDFTVTPEGIGWLATLYYNPGDEKNPYVSPYFDDMHGMPPTFLSWDQSETLAVDCEELVKKLLAQGVECHFKSYPDCFHAFAPIGRNTPESNEVLQNTVRFINAHIK